MAVRAASWALLGILFAGIAGAAGPPATTPPAADSFPVATEVRLGGDEAATRFIMDLSRKIDLRAFTLSDPYRVVLDIPQVTFQLPPKAGESGRGLIKAFRFGLMMPGGSRMVLDLAKPARIDKAFVVEATADAPARLGIDLARAGREFCAKSRSTAKRPAPKRRRAARRRPTADRRRAGGARSRPWWHRHRHQGPGGNHGEEYRASISPRRPPRADRENRRKYRC